MNKLSTNLPETPSVNNLSNNIKKMKPLLNNGLLSTLELKNILGCLIEQSMCHQSCYRLATSDALGKDI